MTAECIRAGLDADAAGFIGLIDACWSAYPGIRMDVDREMPELRCLASYYAAHGGALWAAEDVGGLAGMIAVKPQDDGAWEICRLYVRPALHGGGLGHRLLSAAEARARHARARSLVLWSDTRFDRAHRFYEKRSYMRAGPVRALQDVSNSLEYVYAKPIDGIEVLNATAAASAVPLLADILIACVDGGARVSFLPPLGVATARAFCQRIARGVSGGTHRLLGGWVDGVLAGTVTLVLDTPQNQPHRAEVANLLVHPNFRRQGLAQRLMRQAEAEAVVAGRSLLTLDTLEGDTGEALYRLLGWTAAGRIPDFAMTGDGTTAATVLFWKRVGRMG